MRYCLSIVIAILTLVSGELVAKQPEPLLTSLLANNANTEVVFSQQELDWIEANKTVTVIGDAAWFPFEGFDASGQYVGIVAEVLNLISKKSSLTFNVSETATWRHTLQYSGDQQVDIISASMPHPKLEENYRATYSTIKNPIVMIARHDMSYIADLNSVKDLRIAVLGNAGYRNVIIDAYPDLSFINVDDINQGLLGVLDEQYDVILMSMAVASYQLAEMGLYELRVVGITDLDMQLTLFVNRNKPILWSIINKVKLNESKQEQHNILSKWIKQKYVDRYSPVKVRALMFCIGLLILFVIYRNYLLRKQAKKLITLAQTDALTNIYNRLYLDKVLSQMVYQSQYYKSTFSFILIDIDFFKQVNEKFGHLVGDKFLKQFALLLEDNIRDGDVLGRWGGEEFLILCPDTKGQEVIALAEHLREMVEKTIFLNAGKKTASFGVSQYQSPDSSESCLARAYKALYEAKDAGRNQVKSE